MGVLGHPPSPVPISEAQIAAAGDLRYPRLATFPFSFRNKIINGGFDIAQRGAGPFTVDGSYTFDRWKVTGASPSVSRVAFQRRFYAQIARSVASAGNVSIFQRLETATLDQLVGAGGKSVTVSFEAESAGSVGNLTVSFITTDGEGNFTNGVVRGQLVVAAGAAFGVRRSFTFTLPANAQLGAYLLFDAGSVSSAAAWLIRDVQLEEGPVATPFEQRPVGLELPLCQRYYRPFSSQYMVKGPSGNQVWRHERIDMRSSPSIAISINVGSVSAAPYPLSVSMRHVEILGEVAAGGNAAISFIADAEL
jgi:hypothetical protein